jgi:hypothetical protein
MKRLSILGICEGLALLLIAWIVIGGCADPLEQRSAQEVQAQLERGVTGQGTLVPFERSPDDPAGQHSVPQTHP